MSTPTLHEEVYRPQADTHLLMGALSRLPTLTGARVADLCCGSGIIGIKAATLGAREVVAVDDSQAAIDSTRELAALMGLSQVVHAKRASVDSVSSWNPYDARHSYDVVTANPPYVPTPESEDPSFHPAGPSHSWNAGPNGRDILDGLCAVVPPLLRPAGTLLLVQSEIADIALTMHALAAAGLGTRIVEDAQIPFGPVLTARVDWLRKNRMLDQSTTTEHIVVISAERL